MCMFYFHQKICKICMRLGNEMHVNEEFVVNQCSDEISRAEETKTM